MEQNRGRGKKAQQTYKQTAQNTKPVAPRVCSFKPEHSSQDIVRRGQVTERHRLNKYRCKQKPMPDVCNTLHFSAKVRSSEWAQASRSESTELSITARPLCSMRNEPSRVTLPSSRAATLYCLAVSRTRASDKGLTDTTARVPRSLKIADSAEVSPSILMFAPRCAPPDAEGQEPV